METNHCVTYDDDIGIEVLYRGRTLDDIPFKKNVAELYNQFIDELEIPALHHSIDYDRSFNIPQRYLELDVEDYIFSLISNDDIVKARVEEELALYKARNLYPILQLMIYIIDVMRQNNLVWGVGRGSSVASYCLYLIGVHKIDSIKYDLDIREFLR